MQVAHLGSDSRSVGGGQGWGDKEEGRVEQVTHCGQLGSASLGACVELTPQRIWEEGQGSWGIHPPTPSNLWWRAALTGEFTPWACLSFKESPETKACQYWLFTDADTGCLKDKEMYYI